MLTVRETAALLKSDEYENILILTHIRPDGDTIGCAAALCAGLRRLGKRAYMLPNPGLTEHMKPYCELYQLPEDYPLYMEMMINPSEKPDEKPENAPDNLSENETDITDIKENPVENAKADIKDIKSDAENADEKPDEYSGEASENVIFQPGKEIKIISVDIATENLFPKNAEKYKGKVDLAIDHHPSFEEFGKNNIVRANAAACGELLYDILCALGRITPEIALPLYLAISTDCGCFSYNNTTAYTHSVAAALMKTGIDYQSLNKIFFRTKSRIRMQLEAAMLRDAVFWDDNRIVILSVPLSLVRDMDASESDLEELSSLGAQIEGVDCAVTMRELEPDVWKFSLRTGKRINATEACKYLGGGGHAAAAGCTIRGASYEEARAKMLRAIVRVAGDVKI